MRLNKVRIQNLTPKEQQNALNEVRILASIHHENVVAFKEAFLDTGDVVKNDEENQNPRVKGQSSLWLIIEYADGWDLYQKITNKQKENEYFSEAEVWQVLIHALRGLKELHDLRIMHRDLKSANIFFTKDGIAKLGDMNVSKTIGANGLNYTQTGTPYYASPEVWNDEPYDVKSDIWSLGCVIYEMCQLKPPFRAKTMDELYKRVSQGVYSRIPKVFSNDLSSVIKLLLQTNPAKRPTWNKLLNSVIIQEKVIRNHLTYID